MEILELIKKRRSVRSYKSEEIAEKDINTLLEAARWSPSAGSRQPVEIIIVKSQEQKEKLVKNALNQKFIQEAPVVFVVCSDLDRSSSRYGERGKSLYAIQDAAAATQNILLTATALGYGTVWVGAFDESGVSETLQLPENVRPLAIVPIGRPEKVSNPPVRRETKEFTHLEHY
ncbi:MAG: nitroreductase family protein [Candidatus Hodarchaeales archaeon]